MPALCQSRNGSNNSADLGKLRVMQGTSSSRAVHPEPPRRVSCPSREDLGQESSQWKNGCSRDSETLPLNQQIGEVGSVGSLSTSHPSASLHSDDSLGKRLRYERVGIVGREEEMKVIQECLDRVYKKKEKQLLFMSGPSGCGKTCLANLATTSYGKHAVVASGKFDLFLRDEPYAGFIDALDGLTMNLLLRWRQQQQQEKKEE